VKTDSGRHPAATVERVVLLDATGRPTGTAPKIAVHHADTPYHLAFSAHVVDGRGRVLVTRRALRKATWPGVWTNACCGHPQPGETLRQAVTRRLAHELGLRSRRLAVALPDFSYRATMPDGVTEHELCPVLVAEVDGEPSPNPDEVADARWLAWGRFVARALRRPGSLSPWSVAQTARLAAVAAAGPLAWLDAHAPGASAAAGVATGAAPIGLDTPVTVPTDVHRPEGPSAGPSGS
jgi:isopentenyl-diphosphate delta-isomerase